MKPDHAMQDLSHAAGSAAEAVRRGVPAQHTGLLRRFCVELEQDESRVLEGVEEGVTVRCRRGSVWLVQEGDCQDVVLSARQSYAPDCGDTLRLVALAPCLLEIEFAEDVLLHA